MLMAAAGAATAEGAPENREAIVFNLDGGYNHLSSSDAIGSSEDDGYGRIGGGIHANLPARGDWTVQLDFDFDTTFVDDTLSDGYESAVGGGGHLVWLPSWGALGIFANGARIGFVNVQDAPPPGESRNSTAAFIAGAEFLKGFGLGGIDSTGSPPGGLRQCPQSRQCHPQRLLRPRCPSPLSRGEPALRRRLLLCPGRDGPHECQRRGCQHHRLGNPR